MHTWSQYCPTLGSFCYFLALSPGPLLAHPVVSPHMDFHPLIQLNKHPPTQVYQHLGALNLSLEHSASLALLYFLHFMLAKMISYLVS